MKNTRLELITVEVAKAGFQRVKRQFLPIRPVLAGAKVRCNFEGAKGCSTKVLGKPGLKRDFQI
ncbi:MAG: hypothetical protein IT260_21175 [Saprospiraceae bacterium]|nr:hypothetical protein [Saprospiraceae bacterium]